MDRAYLAADYHDAGANRVVSVLEELRSGLVNKREQYLLLAKEQSEAFNLVGAEKNRTAAKAIFSVIDDIALFIQREQRS